MEFNIHEVPFSRRGSWLSFSCMTGTFLKSESSEWLYFRTVRDGGFNRDIFRLELIEGNQIVSYQITAKPESLRLTTPNGGVVEIILPEPSVIRFRGENCGLRLTANPNQGFEYMIPYDQKKWIMNSWGAQIRIAMTPIKGTMQIDSPWKNEHADRLVLDFLPNEDQTFEVLFEEYKNNWSDKAYPYSFDEGVAQIQQEFNTFKNMLPDIPDYLSDHKELAAYVTWSCIVDPENLIKRPSMFMSKNWMTNIWSWDHCFNALALSYKNHELAWDQLMTMFDHQDASGAIPDFINNVKSSWNYTKPPIHGWTLMKMIQNGAINHAKMQEIYEPLGRWTDWWFAWRDYDHDGIPQYDHGNDSGWDNSTVFSITPTVESPDLPTFLIIQMDTLSYVAKELGREQEAIHWKTRADELFERLMQHSLRQNRFVPLVSGTHQEVPNQSLLPYMQILLGKRLPKEIMVGLIDSLKNEGFLTEWGLATENPLSPNYETDGYWRGPIWAPTTLLLVDGLKQAGEELVSRQIARGFIRMVEKSGFAENYNALTGEGLRDRAYTWSASVFLTLAHEYI